MEEFRTNLSVSELQELMTKAFKQAIIENPMIIPDEQITNVVNKALEKKQTSKTTPRTESDPKSEDGDDEWLKVGEVAKLIRIDVPMVHLLVDKKYLRSEKVLNMVRFDPKGIEEFISKYGTGKAKIFKLLVGK